MSVAGALRADVPSAPRLAAYICFTTAAGYRPRVPHARTRGPQEVLDELPVGLTLEEPAAVLQSDLEHVTVCGRVDCR